MARQLVSEQTTTEYFKELVEEALTARVLGEPKRVHRVRANRRRVVDEAVLLEDRLDPPGRGRPREAFRRVLGVQVERRPGDLGVVLVPHPVGQPLADPAERSDVVRPDEDLVLCH